MPTLANLCKHRLGTGGGLRRPAVPSDFWGTSTVAAQRLACVLV